MMKQEQPLFRVLSEWSLAFLTCLLYAMRMIVTAPAKINLTLSIIGKRPDGFHALESIMQMLTLHDTLTISEAPDIQFSCSDPQLAGESNLVVRAARLLQSRCPGTIGAKIHLDKQIPTQAGLGGGSSDAATTLSALNEFWEVRLSTDELMALAAQLGSDVPFFLDGPSAVVRGRGEQVTPLPHAIAMPIVLAKPAMGLSTASVYKNLHARMLSGDDNVGKALPTTQAMIHALQSGSLDAVMRSLYNDLEGPAIALLPELMPLREQMLQAGCSAVLLCGSGSTLFGICDDDATAQHAAAELTNDFPWTWAGSCILQR